jgi:serine/threonine protein kinase
MSSEDSRRLRALYAAALQRDPEEWDEYLRGACAGQPDLRARVAALLQAHSHDFLDQQDSAPTRAVPRPEPVEGATIGPYIVRRELGRGGMGVVYLADDTRLSRRVALKAVTASPSDPTRRERLRLEARAAATLSHPGIATVYALEEVGDNLYLAYEFVPGVPLRALLASGPLPIPQVVTIGAQLARALAAAHAAGVIHRDIKPENVMKTPAGIVKILDFGLARAEGLAGPAVTQTGIVMGTPAYMAPEQLLGHHVDFRADLFAFGLLIYELTTGANPFLSGSVSGTFARIANEDPPPLSTVRRESPPALDRIVALCLRKDPAERYQSTQDLVADLELLEAEMAVVRQRASDHVLHQSAVITGTGHDARWWWTIHQLVVSASYVLLIYPAWYVQRWLAQPWGMLFLLTVLAAAAAGTSLRLHLRFAIRHSPEELPRRLSEVRMWTRLSDSLMAVAQIAGALAIGTNHPEFAMLLVAAAISLVVASFVIEPTTERAAFGPRA